MNLAGVVLSVSLIHFEHFYVHVEVLSAGAWEKLKQNRAAPYA
jgi:hypothetical protein